MALLQSNEREHRQLDYAIKVLDLAVENHTKWLQRVHESIICGTSVGKETNAEDAHQHCRLGQWYYNEANEIFASFPEFIALEEPHRLMHDAARELVQDTKQQVDLNKYRVFIKKQQDVIQQLLLLKDKLVGSFHSFDSLTGALNRSAFNLIALNEESRIKQENTNSCVVLIDIDHFKGINDHYGHVTGDHILRAFSQLIKLHVRKSDIFCRFGGEEFVILLPDTKLDDAMRITDKLREITATTELEISENESLHIHFSAGISECKAGNKIEECLKKADKNLYLAKQAGRNRVMV